MASIVDPDPDGKKAHPRDFVPALLHGLDLLHHAQLRGAEDYTRLIVEHDALPGLVAVVRDIWEEHDGRTCPDRTADSFLGHDLCDTRQMIADALDGDDR